MLKKTALSPQDQDLPEDSNQTIFSNEEPIFEDSSIPVAPNKPESQKTPPASQRKKVFLIGGLVCVVFIVLVAMVLTPPQKRSSKSRATPSPTPQVHPQENALKEKLDQINTDLQNADPSRLNLDYPPIDKNIFIDKPQNQ